MGNYENPMLVYSLAMVYFFATGHKIKSAPAAMGRERQVGYRQRGGFQKKEKIERAVSDELHCQMNR